MEGSPYSPAAQSQHSSQHQLDNYPMFGLFTPLLFFMIQYLDPYLASYRTDSSQQENLTFTMTRQAHSIHNFHRALGFMMSVKQDLYLDVLQVISHSTSDVKYRACQILLSYYFTSVGHVMVADPLPKLGTQEELEVLDKQREQQEYEEERQRQVESTQYLPTNTMNRKYHHRPNNTLNHQQSIADSISENMVEDHHVWYPHIFVSETPQSADGGSQQHSFSNPNFPLVHDDMNGAFCNECFKPIKGYGLRCYQCKCSVHYNCFNYHIANNDLDIMLYVKAGGIQKVVSPQFCHIPPQPRFRDRVNRGLLGWNIKSNSPKVGLLGHVFHLVNLYTLMICACCGLPLWGISQQGYRCSTCNRFVHPQCLSDAEERNEFVQSRSTIQSCRAYQPLLESDTHISKKELSDDLCDFYSDLLPKTEEELEGRSFEEVGTMLNVLLLQENILHCGEAAGCLLIIGDSDDPLLSPIQQQESTAPSEPSSDTCPGLSRAIQLCKAYLESGRCRGSTFLSDFYNNRHQSLEECLLSKEEYLGHLSAMMKCLTASFSTVAGSLIQADGIENRRSAGDSRGFLKVLPSPFKSQWEDDDDDDEFSQGHMPNESLDRSTLLSWVMTNLHFKSTKAAEVLLQHIRNLGFFERFDASPILFSADTTSNQNAEPITCIFPVPFAIDCSSNVESLINSIDACLQDVDLSINECGLLLLVRRCWPDPFMSHYTNERLIHSILSWVFDEDERLLMLHAEFTANKNPSNRQNKWAQAALLARMKNNGERVRHSGLNQAKMGVNSGASSLYVTTRAALKDRYIVRWMAAIHDMDKEAYTGFIFDSINSIIDSKREECSVPEWQGYSNTKVKNITR
jgi:hypothetical protein